MEAFEDCLWSTQGGGLVARRGGTYYFVETPSEFSGFLVGDAMPQEWDRIPANI